MTAEAGRARRRLAQGAKADALQSSLTAVDPRLAGWADEFIFGDVWEDEDLDHEAKMLVAITALAATGKVGQLRNYLHGALQSGVPEPRLRAALRMLVVYVGFPTAIAAMDELRQVADREEYR
ncbi:4-carboxymuconolactone decarboxylase [Actinomadura vinacea]|uniref:4-carboxymuconolactone decarboxylase n=1 Tax=Actinomadura vinacea TaxID=115336 RepID=A0ABN3IFZ9_9ACTN